MAETDLNPEADRESDPDSAEGREEEAPGKRRRRHRAPSPDSAPRSPTPTDADERRLARSRRDRAIGGVCGGIAAAYGVDSGLVRAVAVLGAFVGGAGVVAYLAALLLMPLESRAQARPRPEGAPRQDAALLWVGLATGAAALLLLSRIPALEFELFTPRRGALWPALLILLSLITILARRRRASASPRTDGVVAGLSASSPQEAPPAARFLGRPRRDRMLAGVASGFARYAGVDANLVRATLLVIAVWSHGIGVVLYVVLAALVPEDPPAV